MKTKTIVNQEGDAIKYYRSRIEAGSGFDLNMFVEDISNRIMPIGGSSHYHEEFKVNIKGKDGSRISELFPDFVDSYDSHVKERLISTLIREIGKRIILNGECLFEITETEESLYLFSFTSRNTYKIPFYYIQLIPINDWEFFDKKYNCIPAKKVLCVSLPDKLGSKRRHKSLIKKLRTSDPQVPKFWRESMQKNNVNFNLSDYRKSKDLHTLQFVKIWGWDKRGLAKEHLNGFYEIYRSAQLAWSTAILREHIIRELNKIFKKLELDIQIGIEGLPSAEEIQNVQKQLIDKEINFEDAYNTISTL